MTTCPFCSTQLSRSAIVCAHCNARRGFEMFGPMPDRPLAAWMKGLILPALVVMACTIGHIAQPSPVWLAGAAFALFVATLGVRRLLEGSRWFHF